MPENTSKPRRTFRRHVAPFAPVALAMAMKVANPVPANAPQQPQQQQAIVQKGSFTPVCALPFPGVRNSALDDRCGIQGGSSATGKPAESESKNDFCEATHTPEMFSYQQLVDLQSQSTGIPKNLPDRQPVEKLGEGKYVSYIAFVKDAHYSDVNAGEAVNCNIPGNDTNDIHIVLMPSTTDADECDSTTAEMSPHYRPPAWTPENIVKASAGHPIRVQGHLFYDDSHAPCTANSRPNPKRKSLWEIHPVYSFEICSQATIAECQGSTAEWTPLEKVFASESNE
jgi:hypothetical protein